MHLSFINFILHFFLIITLISSLGVFFKKNPIHVVLFLIATFTGGAGLLLINNAEFLAFLVLTVYVGAVAVLFLFVVMMIDTEKIKFAKNSLSEKLLPAGLALILFCSIFFAIHKELKIKEDLIHEIAMESINSINDLEINQPKIFGKLLYDSEYSMALIIVALILFVAIIGVIILTIKDKDGLKQQNVLEQLGRYKKDTLEVKKVNFGTGVNDE